MVIGVQYVAKYFRNYEYVDIEINFSLDRPFYPNTIGGARKIDQQINH